MATNLQLTDNYGSGMQPNKFQTIADVNEYLSGDTIECLICGKQYRRLQFRHLGTHSISADEYRERFGIPWKPSLTSAPSRKLTGDKMTPERIAAFKLIKQTPPSERRPRRPNAPAGRAEWKKNAVGGRVLAFQQVFAPCVDCGTPIATTALCATQPIHCEACATPNQLKARRYAAKLKSAA